MNTKLLLGVAPLPIVWLATVALLAPPAGQAPSPSPSPSASANPTPTPVPTPTQTPPHGTINLSVAAGPAGSKVVVTGSGFFASEAIAFFLDSADHPLGAGTVADAQGGFRQEITVPESTTPGGHKVCVQQQPEPRCAQIQVDAAQPSPSPTPSSEPTETPSASPSAVAVAPAPPRQTSALSGFLLSPFGIILILLLAVIAAVSIWLIVRNRRRGRPVSAFPAATVRHATGGPGRTAPMPGSPRQPGMPQRPPGALPRQAGMPPRPGVAGQPRPTPPPPAGRWAPPPPPPRRAPGPPGGDDAVDLPEPGE